MCLRVPQPPRTPISDRRSRSSTPTATDGFVEFDEFEKVLEAAPRGCRSGDGLMRDVFKVMDKDGDGRLSYGDLKSYMESAGLAANDDEIKAMIRLGGGDTNGGVSFDGLLKIFGC
ncbi:hypothetical protein HID58_031874 [Brassica napus]|uniref:EF-hand domain-containing protein n=1 Tax=Brassica napus TaxID=3708 RepID=A0ABQ8BUX4_BRANA|nr:hypothetical protein HID58_031874 [Brassica napus]